MVVYASVLRIRSSQSPDDVIKLIVDTSFVMLQQRTVKFLKGVLQASDMRLHDTIDWGTSAGDVIEQYEMSTPKGARPVEFEHFGGIDTEK